MGERHSVRPAVHRGNVNCTASLGERASADELAEANRRYAEAQSCFDKAVALAPREPQVYLQRSFHFLNQSARLAFHQTTEKPDEVARQVFAPGFLPDLWQAARLSPTNYAIIRAAAFYEAVAHGLPQMAKIQQSERLVDRLPKESVQRIREAMTWLENLTRSKDPNLAAGAFTGHGILRFLVDSDRSSLDDLRRSIALEPSRNYVWDAVIALMGADRKFSELIPLCQQRLKDRDTAHNRFCLAKVYALSGDYSKAEKELRTAPTREPDNLQYNLALAAVLMKSGDDLDLVRASRFLLKAKQACEQWLGGNPTDEQRHEVIDFLLTAAIYHGLTGAPELARQSLSLVFQSDKNNARASEILAALGG